VLEETTLPLTLHTDHAAYTLLNDNC